jgi:hypothetical protein
MFVIFRLITGCAFVNGCFVHPTSVVITVGERVRLTCKTHESGSISSWHIGTNTLEKTTVYTATVYKQHGRIGTPEKISDGYFVTRPADNETMLHMNETILSQAGLYVCTCDLRVTAVTTVVVLVTEPKFTTNHTGSDNKTTTFSCSVSFNASSDVSCELKIEDTSGSTVARRNESTVNNGLTTCSLEHTIIANASSDQWYTCNVTLSNKGDIIYSRFLNATVECLSEAISSTTDFLSSEETSENHAIGLSVGLGLTILTVVIVIAAIVRSRRRDNTLSQPTEQSPNCQEIPADQCDTNAIEGPIRPIANDSVTPSSNAVHQDKKLLKENELTLFENDLYAVSPNQLDPSDGYLKDPIYTEIIR